MLYPSSSFQPSKRGFRVAITRDCPLRIPLVPRPRSRRDSLIKITERDLGARCYGCPDRIHARAKPIATNRPRSGVVSGSRVSRSNSSTRFSLLRRAFLSAIILFDFAIGTRGIDASWIFNWPPNPLRIDFPRVRRKI